MKELVHINLHTYSGVGDMAPVQIQIRETHMALIHPPSTLPNSNSSPCAPWHMAATAAPRATPPPPLSCLLLRPWWHYLAIVLQFHDDLCATKGTSGGNNIQRHSPAVNKRALGIHSMAEQQRRRRQHLGGGWQHIFTK